MNGLVGWLVGLVYWCKGEREHITQLVYSREPGGDVCVLRRRVRIRVLLVGWDGVARTGSVRKEARKWERG